MRRDIFQTGEDKYVGGKRYLVRIAGGITPEQARIFGFGELNFETVDLPYAESIGTSLDIEREGISANSEIWGYGMGLIAEDGADKYVHSANSFRIFNAGNIEVHPFEQDLRIEITGVSGEGFELKNETTGDVFRYGGTLNNSDILVIEGPSVTVNGLQALRNTNRQYVTFTPGWNTLSKNKSGEISVNMRFYYK